jgi:hypothetical protein
MYFSRLIYREREGLKTDGETDEFTNGQASRETERWMNSFSDELISRCRDGQTDRWTNRQTGR